MPDAYVPHNSLERVALVNREGRPYCRASVHRADGWGFRQCDNLGKYQDADGIHWCAVHEPSREEKRRAETEARQTAAWNKQRCKSAYGYLGVKFRDALREIARGHNDPRSLATEVLGRLLDDEL